MKSKFEKLFFYADDFGLLSQGDEAILRLLENGKIFGTSVLINSVSENQIKINQLKSLRERKNIRVGIHLDVRGVNGGNIDIEKEECLSAVLANGLRAVFSLHFRKKVKDSWYEQVKKFKKMFGFVPDQIEAHQHLNFHPFLFPYICELASQYSISHIRGGRRISPIYFWCSSTRAWVINFSLAVIRLFSDKESFKKKTTEFVYSIDWVFPQRGEDYTLKVLKSLSSREVEIILHPAKKMEGEKDFRILRDRYKQYDFVKRFL